MTYGPLISVIKGVTPDAPGEPGETVVSFDELKRWVVRLELHHFREHEAARLVTYRACALAKPLVTGILVRCLARGAAWIEDQFGVRQPITKVTLAQSAWRFGQDLAGRRNILRAVMRDLANLECETPTKASLDLTGAPVYLRTDLWFGIAAGGSIGHIAGVLNNLHCFAGSPILLTTDIIATVREDVEAHLVLPGPHFGTFATSQPSLSAKHLTRQPIVFLSAVASHLSISVIAHITTRASS